MCEVFAAKDLRRVEFGDSRPLVALKRLLPEFAGKRQAQLSLAQEFCTLRHLVHPGVVRVYDLHREEWGPCFSMELLEGKSVQTAIDDQRQGLGPAGISQAANIFDALAYLHAVGVRHGDIKPGNVFLEGDGRVVLLDFNISSVSARPGAASGLLGHGLRESPRIPAFSPGHAAPEVMAGGPPSQAADIFSVCCTVYELLAGVHPYRAIPANQAKEQGLVPDRPAWLGRNPWSLLRRGLSFFPQERPDAGELRAAIMGQGWPRLLPFRKIS
jgi:serine/threonine-protein kinase Stk1